MKLSYMSMGNEHLPLLLESCNYISNLTEVGDFSRDFKIICAKREKYCCNPILSFI